MLSTASQQRCTNSLTEGTRTRAERAPLHPAIAETRLAYNRHWMDAKQSFARFLSLLRCELNPLGFRRTGSKYIRVGETTALIHIQKSSSSTADDPLFFVNAGAFVPEGFLGHDVDRPLPSECHWETRLRGPDGHESLTRVRMHESAEALTAHIVARLREQILPELALYGTKDAFINRWKIDPAHYVIRRSLRKALANLGRDEELRRLPPSAEGGPWDTYAVRELAESPLVSERIRSASSELVRADEKLLTTTGARHRDERVAPVAAADAAVVALVRSAQSKNVDRDDEIVALVDEAIALRTAIAAGAPIG